MSAEAYPPLKLTTEEKQRFGLATQYGFQVGVAASNYRYSEPGFADTSGYKIGLEPSFSLPLSDNGWFGRVDGRYANGKVNYASSSGSFGDITEWTYEIRATFGKDFIIGNSGISPYFGGGYRRLFNDINGVSGGYVRESNYYYLPLGVTHHIMLGSSARLATNLEFDYLTSGQQESKLGSLGLTNITNEQNHGYGARGSIMAETPHWSAGPWFSYWDIRPSGLAPLGSGLAGFEPSNHSYELGGKVAYHF